MKDAWPFSPAARAERGAFFALVRGGERERVGNLLTLYLFLPSKKLRMPPFAGGGASVSLCRLAESSKLGRGIARNKRVRRREGGGKVGRGRGRKNVRSVGEGSSCSGPLPAVHGPRVVTACSCWIIMVPETCSSVLRVSVSAKEK